MTGKNAMSNTLLLNLFSRKESYPRETLPNPAVRKECLRFATQVDRLRAMPKFSKHLGECADSLCMISRDIMLELPNPTVDTREDLERILELFTSALTALPDIEITEVTRARNHIQERWLDLRTELDALSISQLETTHKGA